VSLPANTLLLLDTNVVIHLARDDENGKKIERQFGLTARPERPLISSISVGELLAMAYRRRWSDDKVAKLRTLVADLVQVSAGLGEVVENYARLQCEKLENGHPGEQNDLWIAATAKAAGAVLITFDKDFQWLDGKHITVNWIAQAR